MKSYLHTTGFYQVAVSCIKQIFFYSLKCSLSMRENVDFLSLCDHVLSKVTSVRNKYSNRTGRNNSMTCAIITHRINMTLKAFFPLWESKK